MAREGLRVYSEGMGNDYFYFCEPYEATLSKSLENVDLKFSSYDKEHDKIIITDSFLLAPFEFALPEGVI